MAKYLMSERTASWVRSQMERKAPAAASGATRGGRPAFAVEDAFAHPFEVRFADSLGSGEPKSDNSGKFIIWLPSDSVLVVGGQKVDVTEGIEEAGAPYPAGWYVLDFLGAEGGEVYLNVHMRAGGGEASGSAPAKESGGEASGGAPAKESGGKVTANFSAEPDEPEDGETVYPILVASCDGKSVKATVDSAIILGAGGVSVDKVSIDKVTKEDAEDPGAIQFKNFDNEESDGGQGLAERLEIEKSGSGESATYRIKAKSNDSKVHIVARVNGKIKYIPISGKDDKDPDEENPPPEDNPCTHPGDKDNGGGIKPDDDEPGGGGGAVGGGGVSPGKGGTHPGNDNCNCD